MFKSVARAPFPLLRKRSLRMKLAANVVNKVVFSRLGLELDKVEHPSTTIEIETRRLGECVLFHISLRGFMRVYRELLGMLTILKLLMDATVSSPSKTTLWYFFRLDGKLSRCRCSSARYCKPTVKHVLCRP